MSINAKKERKQKIICIGLIFAITTAQVGILIPLLIDTSTQNSVFINYEDSAIFGIDIAIAGVEYQLEWFTGGVWTVFQSGMTNADGMIFVDYPPTSEGWYDGREYRIVFINEWSRIGTIVQLQNNYATEIEVSIIASIDLQVYMDDGSVADFVEIELYIFDGTSYTLIFTQNTDALGQTIFSGLIAGMYYFTSAYMNETVILGNTTIESVVLTLVRVSTLISSVLYVLLLGLLKFGLRNICGIPAIP